MADRIIESIFLVAAVIASRAVGRRDEEIKLLFVDVGTLDVQPDIAHQHHAALLAAETKRERDELVRLARRRNDDAIRAVAVGQAVDLLERTRIARDEAELRPQSTRQRHAPRVHVERRRAAAVRTQELNGKLAEQTEPDHRERFPERGLRAPHALQRDGAERDRRRRIESQSFGYRDA